MRKTLNEKLSLTGRRAVITGAAGNLGRYIANTLAEQGAEIIIVDQFKDELLELKSELERKWGLPVRKYCINLESELERKDLINELKFIEKNINILVNNAAFVGSKQLDGWIAPFEKQSLETWRRAFEVNLTSIFHLCQGLSSIMRTSEGANIINIGSIYGEVAPIWELYKDTNMGNPAAYGASKSGLIQLTKWLSTALAPVIRVNLISPGGISRAQPEDFVKKYEALTPLKRMATEEDMCGAIAFLASDMSSYVTGHNLKVDGGWTIW
ncbi:SDR family oxidoreductase [Shewanella sp.]|uniref:SDR family oxidoreductase n=1 Tax=Shewanella sp. TaxID=50422 RepID=UPI00404717EE